MFMVSSFLVFSMLAVLWFDTTRYIIPNWLVGGVLLAYPFAVLSVAAPVEWHMAIAGATIMLVVGYVIFMLRWMGGGDVKLLAALALWVGLTHLADFIFVVALLGGLLSLALWGGRKVLPHLPFKPKKENLPRILKEGEPVPYGIAIALGFIIMMAMERVPVLVAAS